MGPSDGAADLLGQALAAFGLFYFALVYGPDRIQSWRTSRGSGSS